MTNDKNKIVTTKLAEITKAMENRVEYLIFEFESLRISLNDMDIYDVEKINDKDSIILLNKMIDIFSEFKCIEKLIRFKYPQYNVIFDKLNIIESDRLHGKFFSFLRCIPSKRKPYVRKKDLLVEDRIMIENQTSIEEPKTTISEKL
jgi:hypothetical protein